MKRALLIALIVLMLTGCSQTSVEAETDLNTKSRFGVLEETYMWLIVTDRDTGVMYAVSKGMYNMGSFSVLVDADGTPLIYDGYGEE